MAFFNLMSLICGCGYCSSLTPIQYELSRRWRIFVIAVNRRRAILLRTKLVCLSNRITVRYLSLYNFVESVKDLQTLRLRKICLITRRSICFIQEMYTEGRITPQLVGLGWRKKNPGCNWRDYILFRCVSPFLKFEYTLDVTSSNST